MMRNYRGLAGIVAVFLAVTFLGACATTQSPKEQISDNEIHAKLKTKLTADKASNLVNIDINVTNGIVTLAGEVPNSQVKEQAERDAWSVKGVRQVINNLQVSSSSTSTGSTSSGGTSH